MSKIIPPDKDNIKYLNNKEKNLNIRKLEEVEKLNSFFIILIKISDEFYTNIKKRIENDY